LELLQLLVKKIKKQHKYIKIVKNFETKTEQDKIFKLQMRGILKREGEIV